MEFGQIVLTCIISASIPTGFVSFILIYFQRQIMRREQRREVKDATRDEFQKTLVDGNNVAIELGEATAENCIKQSCQKTEHLILALESARKFKCNQKDFFEKQGIQNIRRN